MKIALRVVGAALVGVLWTGTSWADELLPPEPVGEVSIESGQLDYLVMQAGVSEPAADALSEEMEAAAERCGSCQSQCDALTGCGGGGCGCGADAPWTLPQPCILQQLGIRMGGWLQQGVTFNEHNAADGFNGPVATNDWDDEYQMNQLWLYFDRPADTGGCGWAWGGHIDMLYGTDWRFGVNHGLEDRINSLDNQSYGMVVPQMYAEVAYNRLSVKLGHFAGILDYEVVPGPPNPFYSHSYSYGYTVPQLVTGVMADYKWTDQFSVQAGFHRGWMMFEDLNESLDFMGGVRWTSADKRTSLAYAISTGPQDLAGEYNRFVYSFVAKRQITKRLQYIAVHNLGYEDNGAANGDDAEWYGLNQYLLYTINPCWSANLRAEWLRDDDGARIAGPGNIPGIDAWTGRGFAGHFYELTCGLTWRPHPNFIMRPEVRWDWYDGLPGLLGAPPGQVGFPFNDGASDEQMTFAVDAIITY